MKLEKDTLVSHYKILSAIGRGGMGEVYLAEDTKLNRKVAVKFLDDELSKDMEKLSRFIQEAQSASALNHPNIITIYEIGEFDDSHFIAAEYIAGETLDKYLKSADSKLGSVLDIAIQIASALDEAHQAGIIHRDIKPDNVMVRSNGLVKILDFGIAKLSEKQNVEIDSEDATAIQQPSTSPGMIIGTANYMSPEQAKGKEVDARTDIFSFGVVLYEMLTGHLPFEGDTAVEMIGAIIHKSPKPFEADVPNEITSIINKCLVKDRQERYQTIKNVLSDIQDVKQELEFQDKLEKTLPPDKEEPKTQILQATTVDELRQETTNQSAVGTPAKKYAATALAILLISAIGYFGYNYYQSIQPINSIAILPFENNGSDADTEYLSDGLGESLVYRLSQLPDLKVSPTSSVFRYKGKAIDPAKVAQELGVDSVLTGRIVRRGDKLNISVNLIDTRNGKSLWGEKYERKMSELLATQAEIVDKITDKLKLELSGESEKKLAKKYTDKSEAYELYLKGQFHYSKRTKKDLLKAIDYFEQAIRLDPNFALAYDGISSSYHTMPSYAYMKSAEAIPKAKTAAQKALAIDPTLAEAHASLAQITSQYEWNFAEAEKEFKKALELNPNIAEIHYSYGLNFLAPVGRFDEAIAELKRALELEPLSIPIGANLASVLIYSGRYQEGLAQAIKTYDLEPGHPTASYHLGYAYCFNGKYEEAIKLADKILADDPDNQDALFIIGYAYAKSGKTREARDVISGLKDLGKRQYVMFFYIASIYVGLDEKEKAIAELEKAFTEREYSVYSLNMDPLMKPLRDEPKFKAIIKRLNLPE